jgi:DNA sulfur modification protein DndD
VTRYLPNASHQVIVLSTDTEIIGSYLEPLGESIGQRYRLEFDDQLQQTRVVEGYFVPVGV